MARGVSERCTRRKIDIFTTPSIQWESNRRRKYPPASFASVASLARTYLRDGMLPIPPQSSAARFANLSSTLRKFRRDKMRTNLTHLLAQSSTKTRARLMSSAPIATRTGRAHVYALIAAMRATHTMIWYICRRFGMMRRMCKVEGVVRAAGGWALDVGR